MPDTSSGEHRRLQCVRYFLFLFQLLSNCLPQNFARFLLLSEGLPWPPRCLCLYNTDFDIPGNRTVSGDQHTDRANCHSGK